MINDYLNPNDFEHPKITFNKSKTVPKIVRALAKVFRHWPNLVRCPIDEPRLEILSLAFKKGICKSIMKHFTICWPSSLIHGTAFKTAKALEKATT